MNRPLRTLTCLLSSGVLLNSNFLLLSAQAQVVGSNAGCPPGTREGPVNLVRNGTFTTNAGTGTAVPTAPAPVPAGLAFTSDLPYRGDVVYPSDDPVPGNAFGGGGLSIQDDRFNNGDIPFLPPALQNVVRGRGVNAAEAALFGLDPVAIPNYLYSNPNLNTAGQPVTIPPAAPGTPPPVIWRQEVVVAPNTVYNFEALFFNLLLPGAPGVDPQIFQVTRARPRFRSSWGMVAPFPASRTSRTLAKAGFRCSFLALLPMRRWGHRSSRNWRLWMRLRTLLGMTSA